MSAYSCGFLTFMSSKQKPVRKRLVCTDLLLQYLQFLLEVSSVVLLLSILFEKNLL